ncbi:hypothetical protein GCM10009670_13700 [Citricoccus alkalitolerans]
MPRAVHAATAADVPYSMSSGWATMHSTRDQPSSGTGSKLGMVSVMCSDLPAVSVVLLGWHREGPANI